MRVAYGDRQHTLLKKLLQLLSPLEIKTPELCSVKTHDTTNPCPEETDKTHEPCPEEVPASDSDHTSDPAEDTDDPTLRNLRDAPCVRLPRRPIRIETFGSKHCWTEPYIVSTL